MCHLDTLNSRSYCQIANEKQVMKLPKNLYNKYKNAGAQPRLFAPAVCMFGIMLIGYVFNTLVIVATLKNKKLQGSCNYFIAFGCFADIFHTSAHWIYVYTTVVTGENFIPFDKCLWFQSVPQHFLTVSVVMTLCVGIDRLVSVTFPVFYGRQERNHILAGGIAFAFSCSSYFYVISIKTAFSRHGKDPVLCIIVGSLGGRAMIDWFNFVVLFSMCDLAIYSAVWVILRFKAGTSEDSKKAFRSLFAVMITVAFGWLANAFVQAVIVPAFIPIEYHYDFMAYFGIPVNLASSCGFVTLYIFSAEYRRTFRRLLGLSPSKPSGSTFTTPTSRVETSKRSFADIPVQ
ncbi:unnamed protein product [Bursaphelenchus xylophilus]|uniref:(pine wood nematode) hypothetical protein n=1 Tax=Bursaphelenchus xylophilus TaxID=6326 RepID=A0A7I8WVL7_BURXY|nr:unnamed protein product [Bursaphelenchus xylophilus]CAG9117571.1 unnamed protein product [Bursaphelenchus xylophilus]